MLDRAGLARILPVFVENEKRGGKRVSAAFWSASEAISGRIAANAQATFLPDWEVGALGRRDVQLRLPQKKLRPPAPRLRTMLRE